MEILGKLKTYSSRYVYILRTGKYEMFQSSIVFVLFFFYFLKYFDILQ